jgi:superfamily II DNA or RNA helicase
MMEDRIEYFRSAAALLPKGDDKHPGISILYFDDSSKVLRTCSCKASKRATCSHIKELARFYKKLTHTQNELDLFRRVKSQPVYRALLVLLENRAVPVENTQVRLTSSNLPIVMEKDGTPLIEYLRGDESAVRFVDRFVEGSDETGISRARAVCNMIRLTRNAAEHAMVSNGARTRRQAVEESVWFRLAYHVFREFGDDADLFFLPTVEKTSGAFMLCCRGADKKEIFRVTIPPSLVEKFLFMQDKSVPGFELMDVSPVPLQSIFRIAESTETDSVEIEPLLRAVSEQGEEKFFSRADLTRFRYGNLQFIPELNILAKLPSEQERNKKFVAPVRMKLKESSLSSIISDLYDPNQGGAAILGLNIIDKFERLEISAEALDRDWCWLDVRYGFGNTTVSLKEILDARQKGDRFIRTRYGWVDGTSRDVADIIRKIGGDDEENRSLSSAVKLSRLDFLRLGMTIDTSIALLGDGKPNSDLRALYEWKPAVPMAALVGLKSVLRDYQKRGVEWLLFLYDNGFGGLLCDDMGLGKTHQVMALLVALREQRQDTKPFLVVCPATVISHWLRLLERFAPCLSVSCHWGSGRDIARANEADVLVTTWGVLRNDIEALEKVDFGVAAFDEAHVTKNRSSISFDAASRIRASLKVGVTGTPVENSTDELWSLMNIVMPEYLGSFDAFSKRYCGDRTGTETGDREELSRRIRPFILRRLKGSVLSELPAKVEDIRTCLLSDEQVGLYRNVVSTRGAALVSELLDESRKIPYIHIFKVLGMLKQICNHPGLLSGASASDETGRGRSLKFDLLEELLDESLESGQKVVVYSQYVKMIDLISSMLKNKGIGHAQLTGKSRNRGAIVERFNNDESCRVFVGSLLAGGVGIDLTAASVVIHYDRWWNAAKEDQATDRVHRIGQSRSVQVIKIICEGTLEEKIAAIIERKRVLASEIIQEDDPELLKTFDREELKSLLSF